MTVLSTTTLTVNLYQLDYEGPRLESTLALGVVFLFLTLLTGSAFLGHSGADRDGLCQVVLSLCFLVLAVVHWSVLGILSMQKGDPHLMWTVCLQNRCAESLWTIDFGYRIVPTNYQVNAFLERKKIPHPYWAMVGGRVTAEVEEVNTTRVRPVWSSSGVKGGSPRRTHPFRDREALERALDNDDYDELAVTNSPVDFWKRFTERDYESQDPSSGVSLLLTLIFYLVLFVYFFTCATVICSYSAQLYDEYRMYNDNYAEEDAPVKDEEVQTQPRREESTVMPNISIQ